MKAQEKLVLDVITTKVFDTEEIYLDYANNYLTIERIAEHYNLPTEQMKTIIDEGRKVHIEKSNTTNQNTEKQ